MKAKLYISRENLKYNIEYIKNRIGKRRKIIAMVKANAYGIGDIIISKELQELGITDFGVANIEEALRIRKSGVEGMILITSVVKLEEVEQAIKNNISMSVSEIDNIEQINDIASDLGVIANIHIKVDTGMTRLGFSIDDIIEVFNKITEMKNINIQGIYILICHVQIMIENTHIIRYLEFKQVVEKLKKLHEFEYIHILNSDGTEYYADDVDFDTHVRVGIIMYGYCSKNTRPILKLTAPILYIIM